jgi:transcription-repair coupling factor (superfamily II helicase)
VDDLRTGRVMEGEEEVRDVSVELPLPAYIPDGYISDPKDKINAYQRLSSADTFEYLEEIEKDFVEDYGKMPREVANLFHVIELKIWAKKAGLVNIKAETVPMSREKEIVLHMSGSVKPANIMNLLECNSNWKIVGSRLRVDIKLLGLNWFDGLIKSVKALSQAAKHGSGKA